MLTCKQVSNSLAAGDYQKLPPFKKAALKLHVSLCIVCGRYNRQVMMMQDTCRHFREHEDAEVCGCRASLDESRKAELQNAVNNELKGSY